MTVKIRPLIEEDAFTSVNWRNDPEVFKFTGNTYNQLITLESEICWIKKVISNSNEFRCAIIADGKYVGNIYLTDIKNESANYHIFIGDKKCWGKGVGYEASMQIIEYGFKKLNLRNIFLKVRHANKAAIQLYNRLGFRVIGNDSEFIKMAIENK